MSLTKEHEHDKRTTTAYQRGQRVNLSSQIHYQSMGLIGQVPKAHHSFANHQGLESVTA